MTILGRDAILTADDMQTEPVPVPEWGGTVLVRSLTGVERDTYEEKIIERTRDRRGRVIGVETRLRNARATLVAMSVVDEEGERVFSDQDVEALGRKNAAALNRVWEKARELSGLSEDDVEELVKASESDQSEDSGLT